MPSPDANQLAMGLCTSKDATVRAAHAQAAAKEGSSRGRWGGSSRRSTTVHALHEACTRGDAQALRSLCEGVQQRQAAAAASHELQQPIGRASWLPRGHHPEAPQAVLQALLDSQDNKGRTPLMLACSARNVEAVAFLLQQGANPWLTDRSGQRTALHYACMFSAAECVSTLMAALPSPTNEQGARYVDARTISGFSPLHYCCIADVATVRALLAHEPRLIISNKWGSWEYPLESFSFTTPLHVAVIKGNLPVAMEILRHYAERMESRAFPDPRLPRDGDSLQPWQLARRLRMPEWRQLHPATPITELFEPESLNLVGVPSLQALAALALRSKLNTSLQAAMAAATAAVRGVGCGAAGCSCSAPQQPELAHLDLQGAGAACGRASGTGGYVRSGAAPAEAQQQQEGKGAAVEVEQRSISCPGTSRSAPLASPGAGGAPRLLRASRQLHTAAAASKEQGAQPQVQGEDDDEPLCEICMSDEVCASSMVAMGCAHRMCAGCAQQLVGQMRRAPMACPFCRAPVSGFSPAKGGR